MGLFFICTVYASAQQLELSNVSSSSIAVGPTVATQSATFLQNTGTTTTFSAYTPTTSFSVSISNQQYAANANTSYPGITFGANGGNPLTGTNNFVPINNIASPTAAMFTSAPSIATSGTNLDIVNNYAFRLSLDAAFQRESAQALTARNYYGDVTITFNRPVINPVLHLNGLGGSYNLTSGSSNQYVQGFYTELELSTADVNAGRTLTRLSGNTNFALDGTNTKILNTNTLKDLVNQANYASDLLYAGAGSVLVNTGSTAITSLTFRVYLKGDGGIGTSTQWSNPAQPTFRPNDIWLISASLGLYNITGNVFYDITTDNTVNGTGTNGGALFANLVDANGNVYAATSVSAGGTYTFSNVATSTYTIILSTSAGTVGSPLSTASLPGGYLSTGENIGTAAGSDGTADGKLAVTVSNASIANANFGIRTNAISISADQYSCQQFATYPGFTINSEYSAINGNLNGNTFSISFGQTGLYNATANTAGAGATVYDYGTVNDSPNFAIANSGWPAQALTVDMGYFPAGGTIGGTNWTTTTFASNLKVGDMMHLIDVETSEKLLFEFLDSGGNPLPISGNVQAILGSTQSISSVYSEPTSTRILLDGSALGVTNDPIWSFQFLSANVKSVRFYQYAETTGAADHTYDFTFSTTGLATPTVGAITQPTCTTSTGSVVLSGLPSSGTWTLTRMPGAVTTTGTGTTAIVSDLASGAYTFTVSHPAGCTSLSTSSITILTPNCDYGDAPVGYEANSANASVPARNTPSSTLRIGTLPDGEASVQSVAVGADNNGTNGDGADEDGITSPPPSLTVNAVYSRAISVTNTSGGQRTLHGWIDFNNNGIFELAEYTSVNVTNNTTSGTVTLSWTAAQAANVSDPKVYMRLRLSAGTMADNSATTVDERAIADGANTGTYGTVSIGEVEDYQLSVASTYDYGDAPISYEANNANTNVPARHIPSATLRLGNIPDTEADAASVAASADNNGTNGDGADEDGVSTFPGLTIGSAYSLSVTVTNTSGAARTLHGWMDFNADGRFSTGEYATVSVPNATNGGTVTLSWSAAQTALITTSPSRVYMRLRLSGATALADNATTTAIDERSIGDGATGGVYGTAQIGEIEDYTVSIAYTDLVITKTGPASVTPSGSVSYTLVVTNSGPSAANGATLLDAVATDFTASSVSCAGTSGGAVCPATLTVAALQAGTMSIPTLPSGSSLTLVVAGTAASSAGTITNVASVSAPAGVNESNTSNNSSSAITSICSILGTPINCSDASPSGTQTAIDLVLYPGDVVTPSFSELAPATGPAFSVPLSATIGSGLSITTINNELSWLLCGANSTTPAQAITNNDYVQMGFVVKKNASNLRLYVTSIRALGLTYSAAQPGGLRSLPFTVEYHRVSSSGADLGTIGTTTYNTAGQLVTTSLPSPVELQDGELYMIRGYIYNASSGGCLSYDNPTIGGTYGYYTTAVCSDVICSNTTRTYYTNPLADVTSRTWSVDNGATIISGQGSNTVTIGFNNIPTGTVNLMTTYTNSCGVTSTATLAIPVKNCTADLTITKTGPSVVSSGGTVSYSLVVTNVGSTSADGATVKDAAVTNLSVTAVTCAGTSGGAGCPTSPTVSALQAGTLAIPTLPSGSSLTLVVTGTASASGTITNVASVSAPSGLTDSNPADNSSTAVTTIQQFVTVSGKVWDDADGNLSQNGSETGTNASSTLYVNVVNASNTVVASVSVAADGSYSLSSVPVNVSGYKLVLASTATATTPGTLLTGWVNTGESADPSNTAMQGSTLGVIELNIATSAIVNQNFGIEKLPTPGSGSSTVTNAGGTSPVTVPASTFTSTTASVDTSPGSVTAIHITAFPTNTTSLTINGTTYTASSSEFTSGTGVVVATNGSGAPTVPILVDPTNDSNPVVFTFKAIDNAGKESTTTGTATISSTLLTSILGKVWDDADGSLSLNGSETTTNAGGPLYVNLIDGSNTVVASVSVAADGSYSLSGVPTNVTGYKLVLASTATATSAGTLPTGWVNTGESVDASNTATQGSTLGVIELTTTTSAVVNQNFGIEKLPTPGSGTATVANAGGTTPVSVPATTFTSTTASGDTAPGSVTAIHITSFPTNTSSLTINGSVYGSDSFPVGGILIPTDGSGNPSVSILVDPTNDSNPVVFTFTAVDNAGKESTTSGTATISSTLLTTISGKVWDDADGSLSLNGSETGTDANSTLYVNLVDGSNTVVASVSVAADGSYSLSGVPTNVTGYKLVLASTATATTPGTLPTSWVNTGESVDPSNTATQGSTLGVIELSTSTAAVTAQNFGIEKLPSAGSGSNTVVNAGGTTPVPVATNTFTNGGNSTDTAPGSVTAIRVTVFPTNTTSLTVNGSVYTASSPEFTGGTPTGLVIPTDGNGNPTVAVAVDPTDDSNPVSISFKAVDNAGKESSNTGTAVISSTPTFTLSGNVLDDGNGLSDNTVNTFGPSALSPINGTSLDGSALYATLVNGGSIVTTVPVSTGGVYTFTGVPAGTYSVVLSTSAAGSLTSSLPASWTSTGENLGAGAGSDASANGILTGIVVGTVPVSDANFGIDKTPVVVASTDSQRPNPGGSTTSPISSTVFSGTDSEDGTYANLNGRTVTLTPATNGTLYYNGTPVNSTTAITGFNPTLVSIDPTATGATTGAGGGSPDPTFTYSVTDDAGVASTPQLISIPFTVPLVLSGTVFNDPNGLTNSLIDGTPSNLINGNTLYVSTTDPATGNVLSTTAVAGDGTYSLPVTANTNYSVVLSNSPQNLGQRVSNTLLTGAVNTGEGTTSTGDGTPNGSTPVSIVTTSVTGVNFGVDILPTATSATLASQPNPGGTLPIVVPPASFTGTDPDGTVASVIFTGFPTGVTSVTINGTAYTAGSFPQRV
ncbi:beta strand repeat-containing protein [Spirosoma sp. KNUC1025]|uniref:beta strand repeat-containing protein n=1 Tax=Spirosoma sp. KNUC1025 TaxID=2894082 RepID=UPI00386BE989|nr:DUF11 domain-containing protein [Spirosoma sp. KNUC1025]